MRRPLNCSETPTHLRIASHAGALITWGGAGSIRCLHAASLDVIIANRREGGLVGKTVPVRLIGRLSDGDRKRANLIQSSAHGSGQNRIWTVDAIEASWRHSKKKEPTSFSFKLSERGHVCPAVTKNR